MLLKSFRWGPCYPDVLPLCVTVAVYGYVLTYVLPLCVSCMFYLYVLSSCFTFTFYHYVLTFSSTFMLYVFVLPLCVTFMWDLYLFLHVLPSYVTFYVLSLCFCFVDLQRRWRHFPCTAPKFGSNSPFSSSSSRLRSPLSQVLLLASVFPGQSVLASEGDCFCFNTYFLVGLCVHFVCMGSSLSIN